MNRCHSQNFYWFHQSNSAHHWICPELISMPEKVFNKCLHSTTFQWQKEHNANIIINLCLQPHFSGVLLSSHSWKSCLEQAQHVLSAPLRRLSMMERTLWSPPWTKVLRSPWSSTKSWLTSRSVLPHLKGNENASNSHSNELWWKENLKYVYGKYFLNSCQPPILYHYKMPSWRWFLL